MMQVTANTQHAHNTHATISEKKPMHDQPCPCMLPPPKVINLVDLKWARKRAVRALRNCMLVLGPCKCCYITAFGPIARG